MSNVEQQKITCNNESFTRGTYNGINVLIRDKDGFINATEMCNQFNKRFRKIFENHSWQEYFKAFCNEYDVRPDSGGPIYELKKGYINEIRGSYVDPRLINYIAFWASAKYAVIVGKIMDSINDKVHNVLNEQQLDDIPVNAKPIFNEVVKSIIPDIKYNDSCWGYRDNVHALDQNEREDLKHCIDEYNDIKERLTKAENQINEWGSFVEKYFPDFKK